MTKDKLLKNQLQTMVQKASRSIAAAKRLIDQGDYDFASSSAYYATFYGIEAILLTKNLIRPWLCRKNSSGYRILSNQRRIYRAIQQSLGFQQLKDFRQRCSVNVNGLNRRTSQ